MKALSPCTLGMLICVFWRCRARLVSRVSSRCSTARRSMAGRSMPAEGQRVRTKAWTVDDGTILANTIGHKDHFYIMLATNKEYGDFVLRLRIQIERGVTGNSGIQIRSRYNAETGWMEGPQIDINPPDRS